MNHLLSKVPCQELLKSVSASEIIEANNLLRVFLHDEHTPPGWTAWNIATAYILGVRQGIHQERMRRRASTL